MTKWVKDINPECPLPEYPRPQLERKEWLNLNGLWDYSILDKSSTFEDFTSQKKCDGQILVPYPVESALSGVKRPLLPKDKLWYCRQFTLNTGWSGKKIILHFGGVDWKTTLWVNEQKVGSHKGGDVAFSFDITDYVNIGDDKSNTIVISVWDPTDACFQERGKQTLKPRLIFYNAMSGIWQTVWIEPVSTSYVKKLKIIPDIDQSAISLEIEVNNPSKEVQADIIIYENSKQIVSMQGKVNEPIKIDIPDQKLWSPDTPFLYDLKVNLSDKSRGQDNISSYFGMRKIGLKKDSHGILRIELNNEFLFQYGPLDQGWWPDGLYTAPTDEALRWDIEITKAMGFNMIRKHIKIEPARWYYHCDKMGVLVWQDMPSGGRYNTPLGFISQACAIFLNIVVFPGRKDNAVQKDFYYELDCMIDQLSHFPSIIVWVPFNEAWGQFQAGKATDFVKDRDPSRLVDSVSGWVDRGTGDIHSIHRYPGPKCPKIEPDRALAISEFGGLGLSLKEHLWQIKKRNWGYKNFDSSAQLEKKYNQLMKKLEALIPQGLSAGVYTQTTDVECEVNGLITYDREVIKIPVEKLKKMHEALYSSGEKY